MDLISRFKKDYFNYLISIIIPALINAVSIPLFKRILGAEGYGYFSITFNTVLLCSALLTGWITQSIIRYFATSTNKQSFINKSLLLSLITQSIFFLPVFGVAYYLKSDWILSFFFAFTLFITSMQFSVLAIGQAAFLSKKNIYSELIRTISYITIALVLLTITGTNYMYSLFTAIFISYLLSFIYLFIQSNKLISQDKTVDLFPSQLGPVFKSFMFYGGPLSLWFVFMYLISIIDKYFMLKSYGPVSQGNYQAMFDFLSKSIVVLISPVLISLLPILTAAYQQGQKAEIKRLLSIIIGFEIVGLIVAAVLYWWFGADILFSLIKIPNTKEYKLMGLIIITGTFIWQMAMVVHKQQELKFKSGYLLGMITIAFAMQLLLYLIFNKNNNQLVYPLGFVVSALVYLFLVSLGLIKSFFKYP